MPVIITGTFTSTGQSGAAAPKLAAAPALVPFNVELRGTFVATVQLERSLDGTNWLQAALARTAPDTFICEEPEGGAQYRLNCTSYTSGTVNYRISL